jgi:hypothetical protein
MAKLDELIEGAFDLHCHVYPEISLEAEARNDDVGLVQGVEEAGMGGLVLKSHLWPTMERAYYLQRQFPGVHVFSSVVLNRIAGGIDPLVVEAAARQGAKVVLFPTWQSANDLEHGGFSQVVRGQLPRYGQAEMSGLTASHNGELTPEAEAVLDAARDFDMLVCTGHLRAEEGLMVIRSARRRGLQALFTHPSSPMIGATIQQMQEAASLGAFVEFVCLSGLSLRNYKPRQEVVETIQAVGASQCVVSTDAFNAWAPPMPELLRMGIGQLAACGLPHDELRRTVYDNPRRVLGI